MKKQSSKIPGWAGSLIAGLAVSIVTCFSSAAFSSSRIKEINEYLSSTGYWKFDGGKVNISLDSVSREKVKFNLTLGNDLSKEQLVALRYQVTDNILAVLKEGEIQTKLGPLEELTEEIEVPYDRAGNYRIFMEVRIGEDKSQVGTVRQVFRLNTLHGLRNRISLLGEEWELIKLKKGELAYPPPKTGWEQCTIPIMGEKMESFGIQMAQEGIHWFWLRRRFYVPESMRDKRIKIEFGGVNFEAKVYVNGQYTGGHFGGTTPFGVDITQAVRIGEDNELCVAVTDYIAASAVPIDRPLKAGEDIWAYANSYKKFIAPIGGDFWIPFIWDDVSLCAYPMVHIADLFLMASVREKKITLNLTVKNEDNVPHELNIENRIYDRDGDAKNLKPYLVTVMPGKEQKIEIAERWENPRLWWADSPHLYNLTTTLKERGETVDCKDTRFGFREIWTEQERIILNGVPIHILGTSETWLFRYNSLGKISAGYLAALGLPLEDRSVEYGWGIDECYKNIEKNKKFNIQFLRIHGQVRQNHILDITDELGMLIGNEASMYSIGHCDLGDPRLWKNYAVHLREFVRRDRNHPSLIMWSIGNEMLWGRPGEHESELGELSDVIKSEDPGRLITYEAEVDPGGKADVINLHYPFNGYRYGHYQYPEALYWLEKKGMPDCYPYLTDWKWDRKKPLMFGEFCLDPRIKPYEASTVSLGDQLYKDMENMAHEAVQEGHRKEIEVYRYLGVSALSIRLIPEQTWEVSRDAFLPVCANFKEYDHNFYSKEKVKRTLFVHNDKFMPLLLELKWSLKSEDKVINAGKKELRILPGTVEVYCAEFEVPLVERRTPVRFEVQLFESGKVIFSDYRKYSVFPRLGVSTDKMPTTNILLYDKAGRTESILKEMNIPHQPLKDVSGLSDKDRILIIGYHSLDESIDSSHVSDWVKRGGRVICFEQKSYPVGLLPVKVRMDEAHSANIAFRRTPGHPALEGLKDEDLKFWHADYRVAGNNLRKPDKGNFKIIVDAGGTEGLGWTPLIEIFSGKGSWFLSQLLLTEHAGIEPAADKILSNLISYVQTPLPHRQTKTGLIADKSFTNAMTKVGLIYDILTQILNSADLNGYGLLIIGGDEGVWKEVSDNVDKMKEYVNNGGNLLIHNIGPRDIDILNKIAGSNLNLQPASASGLLLCGNDPVISGLSNEEFYWPTAGVDSRPGRLSDYYCLVPEDSGFKPLTRPAGLVRVDIGKGTIIVDQILWDREKTNRRKGLRIISSLLTNLGADLSASGGVIKLEDFVSVDLKPYCNMGFKDEIEGDKGGGWSDQGSQDMRYFPTGQQVLNNIPFEIINPQENQGRSCIVLKGTLRPYFPAGVKGIKVGARASKLYFLHSSAYTTGNLPIAKYIIRYQDGSGIEMPLRPGIEIRDWFGSPMDLSAAEVAWTGPCPTNAAGVSVYSMEWVNTSPSKVISTIDFVSENQTASAILVGITALKGKESQKTDASLVGYWNFDTGKGKVTRDSSPNKNDGQITGAVWVKEGQVTALEFNGVDDCVVCPSNGLPAGNEARTMAAWVKTTQKESAIVMGWGRHDENAYSCFITGGGHFTVGFWSNDLTSGIYGVINDGNWHYIVGTYDGETIRTYVDGVAGNTKTTTAVNTAAGTSLYIGQSGASGAWFKGTVKEIAVYNRALTEEEIKSNYKYDYERMEY